MLKDCKHCLEIKPLESFPKRLRVNHPTSKVVSGKFCNDCLNTPLEQLTRKCKRCELEKPLSIFAGRVSNAGLHGKTHTCKLCVIEHVRKWTRDNPEKRKAQVTKPRAVFLSRLCSVEKMYGLTKERYQELWEKQGGVCATCLKPETTGAARLRGGGPRNLCVDHDHKSGKVRGFLCNKCNSALGYVSEDIEVLARMIEYLKRSYE